MSLCTTAIKSDVGELRNAVSSISDVRKVIYRPWLFAFVVLAIVSAHTVRAFSGAAVPWTTYEAENMTNSGGTILTNYTYNNVAAEASGRKCVQLNGTGQYVQFTNQSVANTIVVRYNVPDTANGTGTNYTLSLFIIYTNNDVFVQKLQLTSKYSWLYGSYGNGTPAWTNNPAAGNRRNLYDEVRTNGLVLNPGDVVRLQKDSDDTATNYVIDLVDLENAVALTQPVNSTNIMNFGAYGDGSHDDTVALMNCIAVAISSNRTVWLPPGIYKITNSINLPAGITIQGAGMWYSTLVGDPVLYTNSSRRVTLNGTGSGIHLSDFAIVGKLNYRNDSEPNDGLGGAYGTGSTIARVWVEHTKTGAWLVNSSGLVVSDCRFRNNIADGINLCVGMQSTTVTNCTARGTGDDCFAIWPATYLPQIYYLPVSNVITHCTAQTPFLANGGAIYGSAGNRIEDCLFQDMTYGCGILISTTFRVGTNTFSGTTVAQRSDLLRCGGYDPNGYQWRAAFQLCLDWTNSGIPGVNLNNLNITDSISDGLSVIGGTGTGATGTLSGAVASYVNITNYGKGPSGRNGLWARSDALGSMTISNSTIIQYKNDNAPGFSFTFVTSNIPVTVQTGPSGRSYTVDGTAYSTAHVFSWLYGSSHTIATTSPQSGGTGVQYVWGSWSDSNAISHTVIANSVTTNTANFTTQYYLTMNAGTGGSVTPSSGWTNSGAVVNISATASNGYSFGSWTGSGSGSYSGNNSSSPVTMNGPITETAAFALIPTKIISLSGDLAFGNVAVGGLSNRTTTLSNIGNSVLTVSNITYPNGFSGTWSGGIPAGGSTNLNVTFSPSMANSYSGNLVVDSDATGGSNILGLSGTGVLPPSQQITGVTVDANSGVTLTYATTPGFVYHLETTTNLLPAIWITVAGSLTNAAGSTVTFTDTNRPNDPERYYRTVSPSGE